MDTTDPTAPPRRRASRRLQPGLLAGAALMLLLILASRFVTDSLVIHRVVTERSCRGGVCVERVHTPDLLFVPGSREIQLRRAGIPRYYLERDPFDEYTDVTIEWRDGGVRISDGVAALTWEAGTIDQLGD